MKYRAPVSLPIFVALWMAGRAGAGAMEPEQARLRVSVKRVLSASGALPSGRWGSAEIIRETLDRCNAALARTGLGWTLDLVEIQDARATAGFFTMASNQLSSLEAAARADPAGFFWRGDAINIYVVDEITDAGGTSFFPSEGEAIAINSRTIFAGSLGWLHEMGHYLNLRHTHEADDLVADTIFDPPLPEPFDCGRHDRNFIDLAVARGEAPADIDAILHNLMSYHCSAQFLTPLQVIRMHRALWDYRAKVLEPLPADRPPVAEIRLPPEASGGRVSLAGGRASVLLDGSFSTDGDGGSGLAWEWSLASGPEGGARFDSPPKGWERGRSGIGYGDDDDMTALTDMRGNYLTVYLTRTFDLADPAAVADLSLDIAYDDGFAAYLNGVEVARRNLAPNARNDTPAMSPLDNPAREVIDLSPFRGSLIRGSNRLSVEVHNSEPDSSDLSAHPILAARLKGQEKAELIPSRAVWHFRRGSEGAPPAGWKEPGFDPTSSRVQMTFTRPGTYRIRLAVDDGLPPDSTDSSEVEIAVTGGGFSRGDADASGAFDLTDAIFTLLRLYAGGAEPSCLKAADSNDDGQIDVTDAVYSLRFLFLGDSAIPAPYPACGEDVNPDPLSCEAFPPCGTG